VSSSHHSLPRFKIESCMHVILDTAQNDIYPFMGCFYVRHIFPRSIPRTQELLRCFLPLLGTYRRFYDFLMIFLRKQLVSHKIASQQFVIQQWCQMLIVCGSNLSASQKEDIVACLKDAMTMGDTVKCFLLEQIPLISPHVLLETLQNILEAPCRACFNEFISQMPDKTYILHNQVDSKEKVQLFPLCLQALLHLGDENVQHVKRIEMHLEKVLSRTHCIHFLTNPSLSSQHLVPRALLYFEFCKVPKEKPRHNLVCDLLMIHGYLDFPSALNSIENSCCLQWTTLCLIEIEKKC
jgi:hypothetical protein